MPRLALISDQHGNDVAFEAVVDDIQACGVDEIVCLGDVAQGGMQPRETLRRLKSLGCRTVLGNADAFLLSLSEDSTDDPERMRAVREWTREQLDPEDVDFMRTFEPRIEIEFAGAQLVCFHGSPNSYDDILLPDYEGSSLIPFMGEESADLLAGGHTHRQWTRRIGNALFVNPGSIGFVYDVRIASEDLGRRRPHLPALAEYAVVIVDETGLGVEFRTVSYSGERLVDVARRSSRPHVGEWIRQWAQAEEWAGQGSNLRPWD